MTSTKDSVDILIVAAEASSALYAQRLLEYWRSSGKSVNAFGVGSRAMEELGFHIVGRSEELAVVGLQEVIAHWGLIKGTFNGLLKEAEQRKPKLALLLDYPGFNLRLAKKLKRMGIPVVYYISPQVWAWRQSRVHLIKKIVDKMLVLFSFEKDFYQRFDVPSEFVGHPLLDELNPELFDKKNQEVDRGRFGIKDDELVLGLMPGSRYSELKHHLNVQIEAAGLLRKQFPKLKVLLLVAPTFSLDEMRALLPSTDVPLMLVKDEPFKMINLTDVVLCASGTATLMVGLMEKPMVVMYRMNPITAWLAKLVVKSTAHFGLINLVLNERVAPELFQEQADSQGLSLALAELIGSEEKRRQMGARLSEAKKLLGDRGATVRVAKAVEAFW